VQIDEPAIYSALTLHMKYDDGFVAYLNGSEIARRRAPDGEPAWNAAAADSHDDNAAREFVERDGALVPSGEPETRWFFTTRNPSLEASVADALQAEKLDRSLILAPDVFGEQPTTDGGAFYPRGVPLVNYLTAPFYLFDEMDRMDKIDEASLVPVTRTAVRLVESTRGISAAAMRSGR
jgi:hypothetical protein